MRVYFGVVIGLLILWLVIGLGACARAGPSPALLLAR
jgi:hypothetical protein